MLEADLYRSEARLAALARPVKTSSGQSAPLESRSAGDDSSEERGNSLVSVEEGSGGSGGGRAERLSGLEGEEKPRTKEEGHEQWRYFLEQRFLRGEDGDFDYAAVDESQEWDGREEDEELERWIEDEDEGWASGKGKGEGETGVQDF